jgi:hypothetical protein
VGRPLVPDCSLEPIAVHRRHKCFGDLRSGVVADDTIYSTPGAKGSLSHSSGIVINSVGDQRWIKHRTTIEAPGDGARENLFAVSDAMPVGFSDVRREGLRPRDLPSLPPTCGPCHSRHRAGMARGEGQSVGCSLAGCSRQLVRLSLTLTTRVRTLWVKNAGIVARPQEDT